VVFLVVALFWTFLLPPHVQNESAGNTCAAGALVLSIAAAVSSMVVYALTQPISAPFLSFEFIH
jgi:hypothetical protein